MNATVQSPLTVPACILSQLEELIISLKIFGFFMHKVHRQIVKY